jgi:hypothetical protein
MSIEAETMGKPVENTAAPLIPDTPTIAKPYSPTRPLSHADITSGDVHNLPFNS